MTGPAFRANLKEPFRQLKVLPNYRFLSLGRSGMRFKMDYAPTLALVASIFFVLLLCFLENFPFLLLLLPFCLFLQVSFCLSNGSHMSTKWPRDCCDKTLFCFFFFLAAGSGSWCSAYGTQNLSLVPAHLSKPHDLGTSWSISRPAAFSVTACCCHQGNSLLLFSLWCMFLLPRGT